MDWRSQLIDHSESIANSAWQRNMEIPTPCMLVTRVFLKKKKLKLYIPSCDSASPFLLSRPRFKPTNPQLGLPQL